MKKTIALILTLVTAVFCAACSDSGKDVDLEAVYSEITQKVTLPDLTQINTDDLLMSFYGIDAADAEQYVAYISSTSVRVDEIVMIKAVDSDAADRIKSALQTRYDSQYSANKNYLPDQAKIIEDCEVSQNGLYVRMFISPDAETMVSVYSEAFK